MLTRDAGQYGLAHQSIGDYLFAMGYHLKIPLSQVQTLTSDFSAEGPKTHTPALPMQDRGHRFYNPTIGRWISRDPIGERGGENIFHYGFNSSPNGFDSDGLGWNWIIVPIKKIIMPSPWDPGVVDPPALGGPILPPGPWKYVGEADIPATEKEDICADLKLCFYQREGSHYSDMVGPTETTVKVVFRKNKCPLTLKNNWQPDPPGKKYPVLPPDIKLPAN